MLIISLDECGQFERNDGSTCMIGGLIYAVNKKPQNNEAQLRRAINQERERIHQYLKKHCPPFRFPQALHYERDEYNRPVNKAEADATKKKIKETFAQFLKEAETDPASNGKYYIYAVVSDSKGVSMFQGEDKGNLLLDSFAGNKYRHMTSMALHNLLINNPVLQDQDYHLELATRVLAINQNFLTPEQRTLLQEQARQIGMSAKRLNNSDDNEVKLYTLTDANSYISMLSSSIAEHQDQSVNFNLKVQSINYHGTNDSVSFNQGFLYLADIVCSLLQEELDNGISKLYQCANSYTTHKKNMIWQYSDTDVMLQEATRLRIHGQWFQCLSLLYDIDNLEDKIKEKEHYRTFWVPCVLAEMKKQASPSLVYQAASQLNDYIHTPNASTSKGLYIIHQLEDFIQESGQPEAYSNCQYFLSCARISLANHRGDFKEANAHYYNAIANAQYAPIDHYLELRNAHSVSLLDQLSFQKALENTQKTKEYEEMIEEIRLDALREAMENAEEKPLQGSASNESTSLHFGMTLSQLGQCHAFLGDHLEAQQCFRKALERFGGDAINLSITHSYLLHSYIESGMREEYEALAAQYFSNAKSMKDQLNKLRHADHLSRKFALFVFVKAWHTFYLEETSKSTAQTYLSQILNWKDEDSEEHPWELILRHCAVIALNKNLGSLAETFYDRLNHLSSLMQDGLLKEICREGLEEYTCLKEGRPFRANPKLTYMYH